MSGVSLRRQVDGIAGDINTKAPEPPAWAHLAEPRWRLVYVHLALPVPLLKAERAVAVDPRHVEIEAEAERREPALAAVMHEIDAAIDAHERGEPLELPRPTAAASDRARYVLNGPHLRVDLPNGSRLNRRWLEGGVTYDPATLDGAVEIAVDAWAYRAWLLARSLPELHANREIDAGIAWYLALADEGDA